MANEIANAALGAKWRGADRWLSDGGSRGAGRLVAKLSEAGATFYFAYFDPDNKRRFFPIGPYDSTGKRGKTLQAARDRAAELSSLYRSGVVNLHEHFARIRDAEERARRNAQEAARRAELEEARSTLRQLLEAYTGHLHRSGKQSARDAKNIFDLHVFQAAPDLADRKAADISIDDFVSVIGRLVEKGKGRTAGKLRSYLRAAYSLALRSRTDPAAPLTLRAFGITTNPIASIGALSQFNRVHDRTLSAEELRCLVRRLTAANDARAEVVLLCLQLGGQRPAQLLRARPADVDLSAATVTLYDGKGARKQPRRHVVPLTKRPLATLTKLLAELPEGAPSIFINAGKVPIPPEALSDFVSTVAAAMHQAKEAREDFDLSDLRRTCETMLAALGVPSDVRAQLQSHGLGGVQQRHYDRHEYALEKRETLERWQRHLDAVVAGASAAKVVPIRKAVRKS
jgi:integrase